MNRRMSLPCIAVGLASVLLAGCASTNQVVPIATGPIATNSARIVVSRDCNFYRSGIRLMVTDNGREIGKIGVNGQLVWDRVAGPMELKACEWIESFLVSPLRINVSSGMVYRFNVSVFGEPNYLSLVSGTPVACGTNTITGKVEYVQQPSADGETKTIVGTIESRFIGPAHFKSGPPLWPCGMIGVAADNGEKSDFLIVGSGPNATSFYDTDGKAQGNLASGHAQVTVGKKAEVKYVNAPANYATKSLAISVRYVPSDYVQPPSTPTTVTQPPPTPTQSVQQPSADANEVKTISGKGDITERLRKLDQLKKDGLITDQEYNQKRQSLLDQL